MAGFRTAKAEQAAIKMGLYGPAGSGKTFTSLLCAEGLVAQSGKRIAFVDTEHGTDFYSQAVPARRVHPSAFDFDALYTRSLTETLAEVKKLDPDKYGVIVLDSITHLWEAAMLAYNGRQTSAGTIPMHAWGKIKKPYKDLMALLLSTPIHVLFCGRQGNEYATDEVTDEVKMVGVKMKAEGETPYEPHILIRMECVKQRKSDAVIEAFAEKDRTGVLAGKTFTNPTFKDLIQPILPLLGRCQAAMQSSDETSNQDAEALAEQDRAREVGSAELLKKFSAMIDLAIGISQLKEVGKQITPSVKKQMLPADVTALRDKYAAAEQGQRSAPDPDSQPPPHEEPVIQKQDSIDPASFEAFKIGLWEMAQAMDSSEADFKSAINLWLVKNRMKDKEESTTQEQRKALSDALASKAGYFSYLGKEAKK